MSKAAATTAAGHRPSSRHSARGASRSRVARRLLEWATEEMSYASGGEGTLQQEDLHVLARGELAGLWEFVVEHVKSPSKAEVIQGNLLLHTVEGGGGEGERGGGRGGRRGVMERERSRLAREEASLRMAVEQMTKDVAQLKESITQLAESDYGVQRGVSRLSRSSTLLSAHSHACQETTRALHEFSRRIRARADLFRRPKERKACYFPRKEPSEEGLMEEVGKGGRKGTGTVLESACTHSVRLICCQLEKALSAGQSRGQSEAERKEGLDRSWKQIESLLTQHSPGEILSSLEEVTQQATDHLHSHTLSINLNRDAQQLKYTYDDRSGGMRDLSEQQSGLLHAVEEQLLEAQLSHIQRSVESERAQRAASKARSRAAELRTEAVHLLQECYRDEPDKEEAVELAQFLHTRLELECAGSRAALERLSSLCSSLDEARSQRRSAVEQLQAKLQRIREFAQIADSKQKQIQALVVHNSSARDRLQKQSTELQVYVEEKVLGHHEELTGVAHILRDSVAREIQTFTGLSLDRLLKAPCSELPACDLSVNRLSGEQPSGHPSWAVVTRSLRLPLSPAPERVLTQLLASGEKVERLEGSVSDVNQALQQMRVMAVNKDSTQTLLQRCRDHDRELLERGIPLLQECLSRASSGLADCGRTAETLNHWWSQPAQLSTPWATQAGFTADQWLDRWRVLAAKFNELHRQ